PGATWQHLLASPATNVFAGTVIKGIVVDPNDNGAIYAANDRFDTLGGVWRSTNGGNTWSQWFAEPCTTPPPDNSGCDGVWALAFDSLTNPSTLYIADKNGVRKSPTGPTPNWTQMYAPNACWRYPEN